MDPIQRIPDRPRPIRFFCNGDPFYLGRKVFVSRKRYPTLDRLLTDLSRKLSEVAILPYGVRQIFMVDGGRKVNSIQRILDGEQREFVCAGFETFRPLQYGQKNVERWRIGKHSMTSLNVEIVSPQKNVVRTRVLSELNVNQVNSRNSRLETSHLNTPTKSPSKSHSSENSRKNSLQPSPKIITTNDGTNCSGNLEGTDRARKESKRSEGVRKNSDSKDSYPKRLSKLSKNVGKNERFGSFSVREKVQDGLRTKDASKVQSSKESSPVLSETIRPERGCRLRTPETVTRHSEQSRRQPTTRENVSGERDLVEPGFVSDRFDVGEVLGEGNFAVVKRCRARSIDRDYAMKIIAKKTLKRKERMVDNELKILKQCRHPNIVGLFDVYETKTDVYLIMELVEGGDLFDAIRRRRKFRESEASSMIEDLSNALVYLHRRHIVHRDVKPENILVQRDFGDDIVCLKLADFGLAVTATRQLFKLCGTPIYVAPEMLADVGYRAEVDLWSMGIILYILLSGYPPFRSAENDDAELFALIQLGDFVFDPPHWNHVTEEAMALIRGLLEKTVQKRLKASEVLTHPWILDKGSSSSHQ